MDILDLEINTWMVLSMMTSLLALWALVACSSLERKLARLRMEHDEDLHPLRRDLRALCATQSQVGDRVMALEQQARRLLEHQNQLQMRNPSNEHYRHAIALVECGASSDDLVSSCGLAKGEAELVHLMHKRR